LDTWIKLYRKTLDNEIWKNDPTAWKIFEYFLLRADFEDGKWTVDYRTMSEFLDISRSTIHKAVLRLKKAKMVDDLVNKHNTTFYICNWDKYQGNGEQVGGRKVDAKWTQSGHIPRRKEVKELKKESTRDNFLNNFDISEFKKQFSSIDIQLEYDKAKDWLLSTGKLYKNYPAFFRNWLRRIQQDNPQAVEKPVDMRESSENPLYREYVLSRSEKPFKEWLKR